MYSFESRIRYSETDAEGYLKLSSLIDYFQDCCTFQTDSIGQGVDVVKARGLAWVVSSWQIHLTRLPRMGEGVRICTMPYDLHGFFGLREFAMVTREGEKLSTAHSVWVNLNMATGLPQRLTPVDTEGYVMEERLGEDFGPRKIFLPEGFEALEPFEIFRHHLDSNHHVNNARYVDMAQEYLEGNRPIAEIRVEYKQQGHLGDIFYPFLYREEGTTIVLFNQSRDVSKPSPYAVVEFTERAG